MTPEQIDILREMIRPRMGDEETINTILGGTEEEKLELINDYTENVLLPQKQAEIDRITAEYEGLKDKQEEVDALTSAVNSFKLK